MSPDASHHSGEEKPLVDGFITFIHVDENTRPTPHFLEIDPVTEEDRILYETLFISFHTTI